MPTGVDLVRLPWFEYPANAKLDFGPLERALTQNINAGFRQAQGERDQQRIGLEEQRVGYEGERVGLERQRLAAGQQERNRQEQQRQLTVLGNMAEVVRGIQDPEQRKTAWGRLVQGYPQLPGLLQRYGQDPADHVNGPDFIIAQTRDPLQRRATEAYVDSATERSRARALDAETRRVQEQRRLYNQFEDRLGTNPTPELWEQESQPGGILHALFPAGQIPPFSEAPRIIQQVQTRRSQLPIPSQDELAELGLNPAQVQSARTQAALRRLFGSAGPGYYWQIDESGRVRRVQEGREDARNPISTPQIEFNLEQLRDVRALLAGTVNAQGRLDTRGTSGPIARGASQIPLIGGYLAPATNEAFQAAQHAALNLSYALSGRQIGQIEQGRILDMFVPKPADSPEISAFKLNAAVGLFERLLEARGRPPSERAAIFDSELVRQARNLRRARELEESRRSGRPAAPAQAPASPQPPAAAPAAPASPAGDLSDDELLRRLGVK
jgi:hypothetical protein